MKIWPPPLLFTMIVRFFAFLFAVIKPPQSWIKAKSPKSKKTWLSVIELIPEAIEILPSIPDNPPQGPVHINWQFEEPFTDKTPLSYHASYKPLISPLT